MMSEKEIMQQSINTRLISYFCTNQSDSKQNRNNGALSAEDYIVGLFTVVYKDSGYVNTKKIRRNYPGIDILNENKKQGIQITVRTDDSKITETFEKIPKIEDNKLYSEIQFIIQTIGLPKNFKKFKSPYNGYILSFLSVTEILNIVDSLDLEDIKNVCTYVEQNTRIPDPVMLEKNVDSEVFKLLFNSLNGYLKGKTLLGSECNDKEIYKTSPKEKAEKFKKEYPLLIKLYKDSLGLQDDGKNIDRFLAYRKYVDEAFSEDLDEDERQIIQSYLRTESQIILYSNNNDPIIAIKSLASQMKKDFGLGFVSNSYVLSFLLNMFFKCDVFPLLK